MSELSANEVIKIVQELKSLERKFGGEDGLLHNLFQISESLSSQQLISLESKKELEVLFQKLQDAKNLKIEVENLKLDIASKKDIEELNKLIKYITNFRTFMVQKSDEINNSYVKLNRLWMEENEVLKRIEKLEKNLISKVLLGGMGLGVGTSVIAFLLYNNF